MSEILQIELQSAPLAGVSFGISPLPRKTTESPIVGPMQLVPNEILAAFTSDIPLVDQIVPRPEFFAKLYPSTQSDRCDDEVLAWRMMRRSRFFDMVPAVLPRSYRAIIVEDPSYADQEFYCIVMERAVGSELDVWFEQVARNAPNPPVVIHQFFCVWFQLLSFLKAIHFQTPAYYHADIKPDNLRFLNNALRFLDFNASTTLSYDLPYGTSRYAPNRVLNATRPNFRPVTVESGAFDLYCAGITLLEVLIRFYASVYTGKNLVYSELRQCFEKKKEADKKDGQIKWNELKVQNDRIYSLLDKWKKDSPIGKQFALLLDEDNLQARDSKLAVIYKAVLSPSMRQYITWAKTDIEFRERKGILSGGLKGNFPKLMASLLHSYSRHIFSDSYPLLYLDYSDHTQIYDKQAAVAISVAAEASGTIGGSCLDVGCAFGSAALRAAKSGFRNITCVDNNPYFHRLAALLWKERPLVIYSDYFPTARGIFEAIYGENGEARIHELLNNYGAMFRAYQADSWTYRVMDYWSLSMEPSGSGQEFDYIICGNFLHWPIFDFERMNSDCDNYYDIDADLGGSGLTRLLSPLLQKLKSKGCLVIVEPSQFFKNDLAANEDEQFHSGRFSEHPTYKEAQRYAREDLADEIFGTKLPMPPAREVKFRWSAFKDLEKFGYKVSLTENTEPFGSDGADSAEVWRNTILGEFNMTLRNLSSENIDQISPELQRFYDKQKKYMESREMPTEHPPSRIYIVLIQRNN